MASGLILRSDANIVQDQPQEPQLGGARVWNIRYHFPEIDGELEKLCKKKNAERRKKRRLQKKGGIKIDNSTFSSSDDDFEIPKSSSNSNKPLRIADEEDATSGDGSKYISEDGKDPSKSNEHLPQQSTPDKTKPQRDDPIAILDEGVKAFLAAKELLDSVDTKVDTDKAEFREPTVHVISDASSWSECCASPSKQDDSGTKATDEVHSMEQWAKEMEFSSDAALFGSSLSLTIPALSGAARGFGSDLVTSSISGAGEAMIKNLRNSNAKP